MVADVGRFWGCNGPQGSVATEAEELRRTRGFQGRRRNLTDGRNQPRKHIPQMSVVAEHGACPTQVAASRRGIQDRDVELIRSTTCRCPCGVVPCLDQVPSSK